jgi:hypothetical protein
MDGALVDQDARELLLGGDDDTILGADADDSFTVCNGSEGVADLGELSGFSEGGQTKVSHFV